MTPKIHTQQRPILKKAIVRTLSTIVKDRIGIKQHDGLIILQIREILYCQAMSNYTMIYLKNDHSIMVSKTLKYVTEKLPKESFLRIHQSYLVKQEEIVEIQSTVTLSNGVSLPISRSRKLDVIDFISNKITVL